MTRDLKDLGTRAESRRQKTADNAEQAAKGWAVYETEQRATLEKTARLRALRLAKEAADKEAADLLPKPAPKKAAKPKAAVRRIPASRS